jgi:hypothetical protein
LPEQESDAGNEFFDVGATIVDPEAGKRHLAAIAAARDFGQKEVPPREPRNIAATSGFGANEVITRESRNVSAALAAHERNLAEERRGAGHPTPVVGLEVGEVETLEEEEIEVEEPPRQVLRPVTSPSAFRETDVSDKFDINVATGSSPSPLPARPRNNGLILVVIALVTAAGGFAAFRFGAAKLASAKRASVSAPAR